MLKITKLTDSIASDIVREIKAKYPNVQIQTKTRTGRGFHSTILYFQNQPGDNATGFNNDPRTIQKKNWEKFLNYLYRKYSNGKDPENFQIYDDHAELYESRPIYDAINTEVEDVDLDFLIKDEIEAIDGYRKMISKTSNPKLLSVLSHILDEETEHIEELRAAKAGVYEVNE